MIAPGAEGGLTTPHHYAGASATRDRRDRDDPREALADFGRRDDDDRDATDRPPTERPPPKDPVATLMSHRKFRSPPAPFSDGTEIRDARVWVDPTDALPENRAFDNLTVVFIFVPPPGPKVATLAFFLGAFFSSSTFLAFLAAAVAFSCPRSKKLPISTFGRSACRASGASGKCMDGAQAA